ncbi:MAG: family N-acetyltransferase [Naasia sp.]|nr:family N-acetyltransferase [Naasia sp.]
MAAQVPTRESLENEVVRVAPLTRDDVPELFDAIGRPEVFAGGYGGGPAGYRDTLAGFTEFADGYYAWAGPGISYAVRLRAGPAAGRLVGTTTLSDLDLASEHAHLGWTAYAPAVWGTAVNPATKLLVLGHAFASGFGRVKLQADVRNDRSRAAISKLGAVFEGVVRRDRLRADGTWRDAAVYSILIDEWPAVRARLEQRIAGLGTPAPGDRRPPAGG